MEIVGVVACTSRFAKIIELVPICREFSTLYIEDWIVVYHVV